MITTAHTQFVNGIPVTIPNKTIEPKIRADFYISYNNYDRADYGGHDTTALVLEDEKSLSVFLILNGNHMKQYSALKEQGFKACYQYFLQNIDLINQRSDKSVEGGRETNRKIMDHINKRHESK